tara:strand:- start:743 stop:865 length:123 start_codon:yes stop_codon:yes gene_type:complete
MHRVMTIDSAMSTNHVMTMLHTMTMYMIALNRMLIHTEAE